MAIESTASHPLKFRLPRNKDMKTRPPQRTQWGLAANRKQDPKPSFTLGDLPQLEAMRQLAQMRAILKIRSQEFATARKLGKLHTTAKRNVAQ